MPRKLQKSVKGYLSKMKSANSSLNFSSSSLSSSKSWILKGCKHVKTLSFSVEDDNTSRDQNSNANKEDTAATLDDVDLFLFENFRSLYIRDDDDDDDNGDGKHDRCRLKQLGEGNHHSPRLFDPPPIRPVGSSFGSLTTTHSADDVAGSTSTTTSDTLIPPIISRRNNNNNNEEGGEEEDDEVALPENCIALLTYSRSPQEDFCKSMREMVESRFQDKRSIDWEFMEELLFGYLKLNDKKSHKFILCAFVDLVVSLRPAAGTSRR
ncbi:Transcription repressor OFP14 [Linum perenne]